MLRKMFVLAILLALPLVATNASAQGFGVYEHGTCVMGRGGATVAQPCEDGSSIFFNPAGLAFNPRPTLSFGATVINPRGGFTPTGSSVESPLNIKYYGVPAAYYSQPVGEKLAVGVGLFAPYGLTTDWPIEFEGRFLGYKTSLKGIYVQPTVAYKVNDNLAIGGGVNITYASLELNQRLDLSTQMLNATTPFSAIGVPRYTDFANVKLDGHGYSVGYNLGVQGKLTPRVSVGARYLSRQNITVDNGQFESEQIMTGLRTPIALGPGVPAQTPLDAIVAGQFTGTGALANQTVTLYNSSDFTVDETPSITFPDQFVVGTAVKVAEKTTAFVDYQFVHWSLFKQLVIVRANAPTTPLVLEENFKNSHGVRLGVEHNLNERYTLRGGFITHTAAAPDETVTPLLPEGQRNEFTLGFGAKVANNLRADFAYQYLMQSDREGRTGALPNNGTYNFMSHLFGATITVLF